MREHQIPHVWSEPSWVDTTTVSTHHPHTVVDLCCGCGGFTLGFRMAGFRPLLGIECDRLASETFHHNLPDVPLLVSPVERLTDAEILDALSGNRVDVLCSGLPCPGFSTNGNQKGEDDRNWLFTQFARLARLLEPHAVAIENVPPIAAVHDGAFGQWLIAALADVGYETVSLEVLDAADYGVPQNRRRAIIVANRWGLRNPYPEPILSEQYHRTVMAAIGDLERLPQGAVPDHEWSEPGEALQARIDALRPGDPLNERFTGGCRRLRPHRPAFTMMANNGQPHIHPHEHRFSSVREMARLQGFPDSFVFAGPVREKQKEVGNAIPPPMAEQVALALRPMLDKVG